MDQNQYNDFLKAMILQNYPSPNFQTPNPQNNQPFPIPQNPPPFTNSQSRSLQYQFQFPILQSSSVGSIGGNTTEKETPSSVFATESQTPPFCLQGGLESITLEDEDDVASQRTPRLRFTMKEDKLLIQSSLNVSKDAVVLGVIN
ncbi:glutathione S-transferase t2-like protein [Sesbania bispinosa]|nr:glutathione S-transferase t2-like protein [Sesbania bispinosa]